MLYRSYSITLAATKKPPSSWGSFHIHYQPRAEKSQVQGWSIFAYCLPSIKSEIPGTGLLSHALEGQVSSALMGLTAVFGMETGVTPSLETPGIPDLIVLH